MRTLFSSVLDQSIRVIQAMIDISADQGYYGTTRAIILMMQCIKQAIWPADSNLLTLPKANESLISFFNNLKSPITKLSDFRKLSRDAVTQMIKSNTNISASHAKELVRVISSLPWISTSISVEGSSQVQGRWEVATKSAVEIKVQMKRITDPPSSDFKAHCPRFPKPQVESWFALLYVFRPMITFFPL
jgi:hypothetical protein